MGRNYCQCSEDRLLSVPYSDTNQDTVAELFAVRDSNSFSIALTNANDESFWKSDPDSIVDTITDFQFFPISNYNCKSDAVIDLFIDRK